MKKRKAFTLVELLVVIAILAILAVVGIIGYTSFMKKAYISNDSAIVEQMNTILQGNETLDNKARNAHEAILQVLDNGLIYENLVPQTKDYHFVYDVKNNRFGLLDDDLNVVAQDSSLGLSTNNYDVFVLANTGDEIKEITGKHFSIYLGKDYVPSDDDLVSTTDINGNKTDKNGTVFDRYEYISGYDDNNKAIIAYQYKVTLKVGFDAGYNDNIISINYENSESAQEVVIRTNTFGTKLTVNGYVDTSDNTIGDVVTHYGFVGLVEVKKVAMASYDEYGVVGRISATATGATGHIDIKEGATVYQVEQLGGTSTKVSVDANATVYDINHEKVDGAIVETTERFTEKITVDDTKIDGDSDGETITAVKCNHTYTEDVIDGQHVYEVCKTCGYTVIKVGTDKKIVADSSDNNVIIPKATYGTGTNQIASTDGNEVKLVVDEDTETGYVEPEIESTPVIDPEKPIDTSCKHVFSYSDGGESCIVTCSKCGLTYSQAHSYVDSICEHCGHENKLAINVTKNISYDTFEEALVAASADDEIKLLGNCALNTKVIIDKNITINLNGKQMTFAQMTNAIQVNAGIVLTINDSTNNGCIESTGTAASDSTTYNSTIYLVKGSNTAAGGKLVLNGGEIKSNGNYSSSSTIYAANYSIVDINGGKVTSNSPTLTSYTIKAGGYTTELTIDDAIISNYSENSSSMNISSGVYSQVNNSTFNGYTLFASPQGSANNCIFNGETGTYASKTTFVITNSIINGDYRNRTSLNQKGQLINCTVNGDVYSSAGLISGENSKFANQFDVSWLAAGKTLTSTKNADGYYTIKNVEQEDCVATLMYDGLENPIYYRSVVEALNEGKSTEHKASAVITIIKDCSSGSTNAYNVNKIIVNDGVTFTATSINLSDKSVSEARCVFENNGTTIINGSISGSAGQGYFTNNGNLTVNTIKVSTANNVNNGNILVTSSTSTIGSNFANNGTFKGSDENVLLSVKEGYSITGTGTNYAEGDYTWNNSQGKFVVAVGVVHNVQKDRDYFTLDEAITYASSGDTLEIKADLFTTATISNTLTIDLKGHTLSYGNSKLGVGQITINNGGNLTIKDTSVSLTPVFNADGTVTYTAGKIKCSFGCPTILVKTGGQLTIESGIIEAGSTNYAICIGNDDDPESGNGTQNSIVTMNGGLVINSDDDNTYNTSDAIVIFGSSYGSASTNGNYSESDPKLIINGGIVWANCGCAIIGQGTMNNTNIAVTGGTVYSKQLCAIYHPQYGQLTISGSAKIKGLSAICFKGGVLNITGGTLEATDTGTYSAPASAGNSGTNITGDALYIEDNYNRGIIVTITGGTFVTHASGAQEYRVLFSGSTPAIVNDNR